MKKLKQHIEEILSLITEGKTYSEIAKKFGSNTTSLFELLEKDEYSARAKEARLRAAEMYADLALKAIDEIDDKGSNAQIARQREKAQFYKWRASKAAPREFGNNVDLTSDGKQIQVPTIVISDEE